VLWWFLIAAEAKAGRAESKSLKLGRRIKDLEIDEHNLFSIHVGLNNESEEFKEALERAKKKHGTSYQYFLLYVRVIALRERAGETCVAVLPHHLVPPKSRPPVVSVSELRGSKILDRAAGKDNTIHGDGAQAYPVVLKDYPRLKLEQCSHTRFEFCRAIDGPSPQGAVKSSLTGTMSIDSWWRKLDLCMVPDLNKKMGKHQGTEEGITKTMRSKRKFALVRRQSHNKWKE
jgi:hypothetical protein